MYILYLRCKDAILAILCTDLPIINTIAGEWIKCLISYSCDSNKCITANEQTIIFVGASKICHVTVMHYTQNIFEHSKYITGTTRKLFAPDLCRVEDGCSYIVCV